MPNKHAMLSASSSARWLACPPSAQLCAALPDTVTDYAREGTCAHESVSICVCGRCFSIRSSLSLYNTPLWAKANSTLA